MLKAGTRLFSPVMFCGCIALLSVSASAEPAAQMSPSVEQTVRSFEAQVMNSYNRGDAAQAARHYAADAFVFIPGQQATRGREAITANIARFMQDANFNLGYENEATAAAASNDVAYTRGNCALHILTRKRGLPGQSTATTFW